MPSKISRPADPVYELESSDSDDTIAAPPPTPKRKTKCSPEVLARLEKARAAKKLLQEPSIKAKELEKKRKQLKYEANAAKVKQLEEEVARLQIAPQKAPKKAKKRVVVEESSSEEEEVVVRRKRREPPQYHHAPPQQAPPQPQYNPVLFGRYD